jgi:hypothetical protein
MDQYRLVARDPGAVLLGHGSPAVEALKEPARLARREVLVGVEGGR